MPKAKVKEAIPVPPPDTDSAAHKAYKRIMGEKDTKVSNLPEAPAEIRELLTRAHKIRQTMDTLDTELAMCKHDLSSAVLADGVPGYRLLNDAVMVTEKSRTSLSKERLMELGVDPKIIAESYVAGEPYYEVRLVKVNSKL